MKTVLPTKIATVEQAKAFLTDLYKNGEAYHPEDDARTIAWVSDPPTRREALKLNRLMDMIYDLPGNENRAELAFCPCGFILELDK